MKIKKLTIFRLIVLAVFVIFISYEAYMHQVKGGGPEGAPSIHALCPYGGLESLYSIFTQGSLISKIYTGTFVLFIISIVIAVIFRRAFCGWICPFGGIQEFFARLGRKIMGKQLIMPLKADKYLRYLKYVVLALTAVFAWTTASIWMSPIDPWAAYAHLGEGIPAVWKEFSIGFILLIITFIGSFLYDRFFCKYLCPMGGFLGIISKISPFKITRDADTCIDCNLCTKICPVNIDVAKIKNVTSAECINCQECTEICPKEGALTNTFSFNKKRKFKPLSVALAILIIYFGGIGIAAAAGLYKTLPGPIVPGTDITDVEELKGYMTLSDIASATGTPLTELYEKMEIPADIPDNIPMKEMSQHVPGFDFHEAKDKLLK